MYLHSLREDQPEVYKEYNNILLCSSCAEEKD